MRKGDFIGTLCKLITSIREEKKARKYEHAATVTLICRIFNNVLDFDDAKVQFTVNITTNLTSLIELVKDPWEEVDKKHKDSISTSALRTL